MIHFKRLNLASGPSQCYYLEKCIYYWRRMPCELETRIPKAYERARLAAEIETGIDKADFPSACPFSSDELLEDGFFPE
ncbi:MAG: DUF29 family protein [Thermodesulfobacteriota bacterium]